MSDESFFPSRTDSRPMIYAYEEDNPKYAGMLKVGFAAKGVERRVAAQFPILKPGDRKPYRIVFAESAMYSDGGSFTDKRVHRQLVKMGYEQLYYKNTPTEYFRCDVRAVKAAWLAVKNRTENVEERSQDFAMRPEQVAAVEKTVRYYASAAKETRVKRTPKFLWNAKMRFGKTFATYQLAKRLGAKRVLVLTFKPAVESAWREDLMTHVDFEGWQFICRPHEAGEPTADEQYAKADKKRPIVCFGSFQDFLGYNKETGGIKTTNEWVHAINWDLVVFDEYHFGAWKDSAKKLFEVEDENEVEVEGGGGERLDETWLPITTSRYLYLSGTPFRAINSGEFIEDQIYNWTYSDEQRAKAEWGGGRGATALPAGGVVGGSRISTEGDARAAEWGGGSRGARSLPAGGVVGGSRMSTEGDARAAEWGGSRGARSLPDGRAGAPRTPSENPYAALPRMVMLTYKIPESIQRIAKQGEFDEFDLNVFFSAKGTGAAAQFVYKDYVQKWLDLIRGAYLETTTDELKLGRGKPAMPFADARLLSVLTHTLWFLPDVASCQAMANLLKEKQNVFYHDYTVNVCAGAGAGIGVDALGPVLRSMRNPLESKTITLSCGKLTTGVTVRPWTGVFMLRNLKSPETYFQTAFRVQSPWVIDGEEGREIVKKECYVFDFALDRALRQISDYSCRLNVEEKNPEKKVGEFIKFLPVIAYDGSSMKKIDAGEILDIAMAGTSATLLARRWESALLVNVDNDTLRRLMDNEKAMEALMRIEGFRALNKDIETIINKSEHVKKAKRDGEKLSPKEKRELTEEEKEFKSKRKEIQEKLIKFATRIPVFMYLTDYREYCLEDVITQLEPKLFKKVTGLNVKDFDLLCSLNVFNASLMNDAVYKFKRYEDASLVYTGLASRHDGENVGLFNTVITSEEYKDLYRQQQATMSV